MITKVREYISANKIVTPKLMAKDLSMDEEQIIMILELLQVKTFSGDGKVCSFGICTPKDKLNCSAKCASN